LPGEYYYIISLHIYTTINYDILNNKSIGVKMIRKPSGLIFFYVFVALTFTSGIEADETMASNHGNYSNIRSITYYDFPYDVPSDQFYADLERDLPRIKELGFNTIWLVAPWYKFSPQALPEPIYDDKAFSKLRKILDLLKANGMQAIIGPAYFGKGWSPAGVDASNWVTDPAVCRALDMYVEEFLRRIQDYSGMVYIIFFSEGAECGVPMNNVDDARLIALRLRATLGSIPMRLPQDLRSKFRIGYHDYGLINLDYARGSSPIQGPIPFDFLSMVAYGMENKSDQGIIREMDLRSSRFKRLYPDTPLIIGELGASMLYGYDNQKRVDSVMVSHALLEGYGFNLWGWKGFSREQEAMPAINGLGITNEDGTYRPVAEAVQDVIQREGSF
jgi:hypothetical protein